MPLTRTELIDFLVGEFGLEPDVLEADMPLFSSSLLDSTSMIAVVSFLEEKAKFTVEAEDLTLDNFDTVSSIVSFCDGRGG